MDHKFINNSWAGIDKLFREYDWLRTVTVNDYPVLMGVWNIFLITIPFFLALFLHRYYNRTKFSRGRQKFATVVLFFLWLLFIPNIAYLMTDIRHITGYCPPGSYLNVCVDNAWMSMAFFIYALIGWISFVLLLGQMSRLVAKVCTSSVSRMFPVVVIPLIALGVLLGLIHRFNSWEVFVQPVAVWGGIKDYIFVWVHTRNWLIFTLLLYILYFVGNKILRPLNLRQ